MLKFLNHELRLFMMNSLLFQAGDQKIISLLKAGGRNIFLAIFDNKKIIIEPQILDFETAEQITQKFKKQGYKEVNNYKGIDYFKNFEVLEKNFIEVKNWQNLVPFYLKSDFFDS